MVKVTKEEAEFIKEMLPNVHFRILNSSKSSKVKERFMSEESKALLLLAEYRKQKGEGDA